MRLIGLTAFVWFALVSCAHGESISVWDFNDAIQNVTGGEREFLVDYGSGIMTSGFAPANIGNTLGSALNNPNGELAGQALRLTGYANNGRDLTWMAGTEGFDAISVSFAIQRTATGFSSNQFYYTADAGETWTRFGDIFSPSTSFAVQSFDLSSIAELVNNPNAGFRITFGGATSTSGNNRIDNLVVSGNPVVPPTPVPESSPLLLLSCGGIFALLSRVRMG